MEGFYAICRILLSFYYGIVTAKHFLRTKLVIAAGHKASGNICAAGKLCYRLNNSNPFLITSRISPVEIKRSACFCLIYATVEDCQISSHCCRNC